MTPAVDLRDGAELSRAMARFLYAHYDGRLRDAQWVMTPAWLEVVDDLIGMPLPRVPLPGETVPHILGVPVSNRRERWPAAPGGHAVTDLVAFLTAQTRKKGS